MASARPAGLVAVFALLAVVAGYQTGRPIEVRPGGSGLSRLALRGLYPGEGDFAWTGSHATVRFPDVGAGWEARLELDVSGWRPRGHPPARLGVQAGGATRVVLAPEPAVKTVAMMVNTAGAWASDVNVSLDANPFTPGAGDTRPLGVRLFGARLVPQGGTTPVKPPPVRQVLLTVSLALLAFALVLRSGRSPAAAVAGGALASTVLGLGYAFARLATVLVALPALLLLGAATGLVYVAPGAATAVGHRLRLVRAATSRGARVLRPIDVVAAVLVAALGVTAAYRARPRVEVDLGSGEEDPLAQGLGAYDRRGGETCREVRPGAWLDLRDLGSGPWSVGLRAAATIAQPMTLAQAGAARADTTLGPAWTWTTFDTVAPFGWRSGLRLDFPVPRKPAIQMDRVTVERPAAWPSLRIVVFVLATGLLMAVLVGAAGASTGGARIAAATALVLECAALGLDPVAMLPFVPWLAGIVLLGAGLSAVVGGGVAAGAEQDGPVTLPPAAVAASATGFVAWLAATAYPRYRGGHFGFHSQIAEEIWQGRFLTYFLPYPGSMLSRQAQWGNVIVPHPCLYHTLVAPLAALPPPWFYFTEKAVLALLLASMALVAGSLATRVAGLRAGTYAAVAAAALPVTFQLLGLGHLMTILGSAAMAWAMAHLIVGWPRLRERRTWLGLVALLALAFLSYFAGLIFLLFVTAVVAALFWRQDRQGAHALLAATLLACVVAFGLYYVYWTLPFLQQSLPALLSGHGSGGGEAGARLLPRLLAEPHKLQYTFGSALVPLAGLVGLALVPDRRSRILLAVWAAVLIVFSGVDLWFNFLLKHHYFVVVPVAVGCGILLARGEERLGRWVPVLGLAGLAVLATRAFLEVSQGWIP